MAATNKTPILLYGSTTPTNAPAAGNLTNSSDGCEIAINVADKNLFFKDSTNAVNTVPIRQSSASSNGWLSSTDWSTFNSKQAAYTNLTSIGSLANATGWLYNNGSGTFSYSTPTKTNVGLGNVTNDAQTKASIVPNTAPSAGQILVGNAGGTAYAPVSMSGDATLSSTGAATLATVNSNVGSYTNASVTVNAKGLVTAVSSGTAPVTSVTGTAPVVSSGGTTPTISITQASSTTNGYLSSTDWNTFNNKTSNTGTVTSVAMTVPTGLSVSGTPITTSGTLALTMTAGYSIPTTASQTNWDSAYTQRLQWDGGSTNLVAATGRTSLGGTTVGQNFFTLTNPTAITFPRINADNTVSALDAATFRTAIGAGTSSTTGTVTSVSGTGTVSGLSLSGTVTTSGNITLGGTLAVTPSNFASQTANTFLAAPNGTAGTPAFRSIVAADIPTLNQNTTGTAAGLSSTLAIASGGTGQTTATAAFDALAPTTTSGDTIYHNGTDNVRLAGNTATTKKFLTQTGTGTVSAAPVWNTIVAADIPTLNQNTTGTAANVTGTVAIANGGTGATTRQDAMDALAGATTSGYYLRGNGADVVMSAIQAADVPTLNQNTTGTASNVTGTVAVANGGTGRTTIAALSIPVANTANTYTTVTPAAGQSIRINAANTAWEAYTPGTGTVTSVTGTAPISSSGGTTPAISISQANSTTNGYLTSTDWTTFNSKQAALVSGTNIKTVNGTTLLGSGDLGTIGTGYGGTGLTSFTANGVVYASSTSALATGSTLTYNGTSLGIGLSSPSTIGCQLASTYNFSWQQSATESIGNIFVQYSSVAPTLANGYKRNTSGTDKFVSSYGSSWARSAIAADYGAVYIYADAAATVAVGTAITPTEVAKFDSSGNATIKNGNLVISTSGKGIDFSVTSQAAGMTSELLSDYEEGTWTPVYATSNVGFGTITYSSSTAGWYVKVGTLVTCSCDIRSDTFAVGSASGTVGIGGLPYTASLDGGGSATTTPQLFAVNYPSTVRTAGGTIAYLYYRATSNGATVGLAPSDMKTGTNASANWITVTFSYRTT